MVGMTLARLLRVRGFSPVVIERNPEGAYMPRGYMLGFQGYAPLEEAGVIDEIRDGGPRHRPPPRRVRRRDRRALRRPDRGAGEGPAGGLRAHGRRARARRHRPRDRRGRRGAGRPRHHRRGPRGRLRRDVLAGARDGGDRAEVRAARRRRPDVHEPPEGRTRRSRWPTCPTAATSGCSAGTRARRAGGASTRSAPRRRSRPVSTRSRRCGPSCSRRRPRASPR